jgi:hypothetical protein
MQAALISNLIAPAAQAPPRSAGVSPSPDRAVDAKNVPSFAQVVRDILVPTAIQQATQPAHTLHTSGSLDSKDGNSPASASASAGTKRNQSAIPPQPLSPTLNPPPLFNVTVLYQQLSLPIASDSRASNTGPVSIDPSATAAVTTSNPPAQNQPTISSSDTSQAPGLQAWSLPDSPPQATVPNLTKVLSLAPSIAASGRNSSASALPSDAKQSDAMPPVNQLEASKNIVSALRIERNTPVSSGDVPISAVLSQIAQLQSTSATNQSTAFGSSLATAYPTMPPAIAKAALVATPPSFGDVSISAVLSQMAQLQSTSPANQSTALGSSFATAHSTMTPTSTKAALISTPLFPLHDGAAVFPQVFPKLAGPVLTLPQASVPATNSKSPSHSGSQDNSSNRSAPNTADPSPLSGMSASNDSAAFSQTLSAATVTKLEAVPASANAVTVVSPAPTSVNEHPPIAEASAPPALPESPKAAYHFTESPANRFVSDAQLVENVNHSEMRIAMQTDKLGAVELRARMIGDEVGAAITVEKRDAHAALAIELPGLQQALSDKQLRVDQVQLLHGSLHSTTGDTGGQSQAESGSRGGQRSHSPQSQHYGDSSAFVSAQGISEPREIFDSRGRLSVRA